MNQTLKNGKKPNFGPDFGPFGSNLGTQTFLSWVLPLLDVRHCCKLSSYVISIENYDPNSRKWRKTSFWAWFRSVGVKFGPPFFFHGQLSSSTISEKTNDKILRKFSDGLTDEREWFHRALSD